MPKYPQSEMYQNALGKEALPSEHLGAAYINVEGFQTDDTVGTFFVITILPDFIANLYSLVKVDGATPKRWLSKGP